MGARPPSAILSRKGIAGYGGVSRTGLLRLQMQTLILFGNSCRGIADADLALLMP